MGGPKGPPIFLLAYTIDFQVNVVELFLALLARIIESSSSPQQVHFHASKERTKS